MSKTVGEHGTELLRDGAADAAEEAERMEREIGGHEMRKRVTGSVFTTITGEGDTWLEAVKDWQSKAAGYPDWAYEGEDDDGQEIVGGCETCGAPIFDGQPYFTDSEGITWHKDCD